MTDLAPPTWTGLRDELSALLLDLPADGLLEVLLRDAALTLAWLLPGRVLLELSGAPPSAGPALALRGWRAGGPGCWRLSCRASPGLPLAALRADAALSAADTSVAALRTLDVGPEDVELWRPCTPPPVLPPAPAAQEPLW